MRAEVSENPARLARRGTETNDRDAEAIDLTMTADQKGAFGVDDVQEEDEPPPDSRRW